MLDQILEEERITESGEAYDCPKYRYFISNVFVNRENSCNLELEDSAAIELNIKNIQSCIDNFNVLHKKDIEKLNILFDKIEVKFGLLEY